MIGERIPVTKVLSGQCDMMAERYQKGEILESYVTKSGNKAAALTFMKKTLKRHGSLEALTTDGAALLQAQP